MARGGSSPARTAHRGGRWALIAAVAIATMLVLPGSAVAHRRHRPVPSCRWAGTSLIASTLGIHVRASKPHWGVNIAPVLTCSYYEVTPKLAPIGEPILTIAYAEVQRFKVPSSFTFVPHLGSCVKRSSCPRPHKAAWLYRQSTNTNSAFSNPYTSIMQLRVEDGLNAVAMQVFTPNGPLPVPSERTAVLKLARKLLPRFDWR